jgi:hypothetical protein
MLAVEGGRKEEMGSIGAGAQQFPCALRPRDGRLAVRAFEPLRRHRFGESGLARRLQATHRQATRSSITHARALRGAADADTAQ